jgi:hypothetical protein
VSSYPDDWKEISLRIRYERAKGLCEWCGAPDRKHIKRYRASPGIWELCDADFAGDAVWTKASYIFLTVSHYDHDTTNNADTNLNALCNRCHLNHDAKYHAENAKRTRARKNAEAKRRAGQMELFEDAK